MSTSPLRILYVTSIDISKPNGPGVNEREFLVAAARSKDAVVHASVARTTQPMEERIACPIDWLPRASNANPLAYVRHQLAIATSGRRLLRDADRFDLAVVRLGYLPIGLWFALRRSPVPYAVKTAGGFPEASVKVQKGLRRVVMSLLKGINAACERAILHGAVVVDACTPGLAEGVVRNFGVPRERVTVVDNATNVERFRPGDRAEAKRAIGLGRFDALVGYIGGRPWERGAEQLIRVVATLRGRHPGLGVLIVGGGAEMAPMHDLANELDVADRVHFAGVVPYDRVPAYAAALDIGVAFDRTDTSEKGNANQKVRQYLACGTPVISDRAGNEFLDQHAIGLRVASGNDCDEIAEAVSRLLGLPDGERTAMERRARDFAVSHLSTDVTFRARMDAWKRSLAAKGDGARQVQAAAGAPR